jgi:hypothetical protein
MPRVYLSPSELQALVDRLALLPNLSLPLASALAHFQETLAEEEEEETVLKLKCVLIRNT